MLYVESPGGVGYSYATAYGNPISDSQVSPFRFCLHKRPHRKPAEPWGLKDLPMRGSLPGMPQWQNQHLCSLDTNSHLFGG